VRIIRASGIYFRHPKVFSTFGVIGAIVGTIQDVFIEYATFGNIFAVGAIALFLMISVASALNLDTVLKEKIGDDWPGVGLAATALFAIVMGGSYYWSQNNQDQGGVLASNVESVERFQSGLDAMMEELGVMKQSIASIEKKTSEILRNTDIIRDSSDQILTRTTDIQDRIEQDPETILKDFGLTLTDKGYLSLLARDYDQNTLEPLLEIFAKHDYTLSVDSTTFPQTQDFWLSISSLDNFSYLPTQPNLIEVFIFIGGIDRPNLKKAMLWEKNKGILDFNASHTISLDMHKATRQKCSSFNMGCFNSHLLQHRNGKDFSSVDFTLAHWAALGGSVKSLELLADLGVPLDLRTSPGYTPLDIAVEVGNIKTVNWLLEKVDVNNRDKDGITFEVIALKAMDGLDVGIARYSYQGDYSNQEQFRAQIDLHKNLLQRIPKPEDHFKITQRIQSLVEPHIITCNESVRTGREDSKGALGAENDTKFGYRSLEQLDLVLTEQIKNLTTVNKILSTAIAEQKTDLKVISEIAQKLKNDVQANKEIRLAMKSQIAESKIAFHPIERLAVTCDSIDDYLKFLTKT